MRLSIIMYPAYWGWPRTTRSRASSTDTLFITSAKASGRSSCLLRGGEDLRSRGIVLTRGRGRKGNRRRRRRRKRRIVWSYTGGSPVDRRTAAGCRLSTVFAVIPLFRAERIISFRYSSAYRRAMLCCAMPCRAEPSQAEPSRARPAGFRPLTTIEDSLLALCSPRSSSFARLLSLFLSHLPSHSRSSRYYIPPHSFGLGDFSGRAALTPDHLTKVQAFPPVIGQPGVVMMMMMMRFSLSGNREREKETCKMWCRI